MRLLCINDSNDGLPSAVKLRPPIRAEGRWEWLEVGQEYLVFGLDLYMGVSRYLLQPENYYYPLWFPSPLFVILNPILPPCFQVEAHTVREDHVLTIGHPLWLHSAYLHDRITEREPSAMELWQSIRNDVQRLSIL